MVRNPLLNPEIRYSVAFAGVLTLPFATSGNLKYLLVIKLRR
jgi:hypothetical protein